MQIVVAWILNHWELVVSVFLFVLSFILQLFKKKPVNDIQWLLFEWCLDAIQYAETSNLKGSQKLAVAVQFVLKKLKGNFPELDIESYRSGVIGIIEDILSTPQKK